MTRANSFLLDVTGVKCIMPGRMLIFQREIYGSVRDQAINGWRANCSYIRRRSYGRYYFKRVTTHCCSELMMPQCERDCEMSKIGY